MSRPIALVLCTCMLGACSGHNAAGEAPKPAAETAPTKQKTVFDEPLKALDKTRAVRQTVVDAAEAQRKAVDDASG